MAGNFSKVWHLFQILCSYVKGIYTALNYDGMGQHKHEGEGKKELPVSVNQNKSGATLRLRDS